MYSVYSYLAQVATQLLKSEASKPVDNWSIKKHKWYTILEFHLPAVLGIGNNYGGCYVAYYTLAIWANQASGLYKNVKIA